ncbi:MAG: methyltransferase domain-containing protein [Firmicutes bacterium]|nr:methyltransferase domain-containing protein [Bacillota bacterium]
MERYTTGKFAKLANVTERTIRYYDKIGLLKPTLVSEKGYRYYTKEDLFKLQKILSLRHLGFSIEEIFPLVVSEENLKDSLDLQMSLVEKRIVHLQSLLDSLKRTSNSIEENTFDWNTMISLTHLTNEDSHLVEQYMNAKNLNDRISLHDLYSINKEGWFPWLFDQIDFSKVTRLLEIGCGNGKLWEGQKKNLRNREIFLSDISSGMVEEVRKKLGNDFNCIQVDCEHIPFKDAYFDAVLANHVLFYVKDLENGLAEIARVLRKEGILYCSTYGSHHMKEVTQIVQDFDSRIALSQTHLYAVFGLENGREILEQKFHVVEKRIYKDALEIRESKPLVDYIMSCHGNQNEIIGPRLKEFREYIDSLLEKGPIHITKEAGIFIAKNPK